MTVSRRAALGAPAAMLLAAGACSAEDLASPTGGETLVAFFSRSGNTRVIAGQLHRDLKADPFEIVPASAYPEDYEATVAQATREREADFRPPLARQVADLASYRTVYLGFPIWGMTPPPIVRSFLGAHDLAGKTLRPFITHGGYGTGDSLAVLRSLAPAATHAAPFVIEADQERRTMEAVRGWLAQSGA